MKDREKNKDKNKNIIVCPNCLNPYLKIVGLPGVTPPYYVCEKCGYRGYVVLEISLEEYFKIKRELSEKSKSDIGFSLSQRHG